MGDYMRKTWVDGEVITAEALNNIEEGITQANKNGGQTVVHTHGNITYDGKMGTASGYIITTGEGGKMEASTPAEAREKLELSAYAQPVMVKQGAGDGVIVIEGTAECMFAGMSLYGKTTQDGTPSPDAPVELVSAGDDGSIGVTVYGKNLFDKNKYTASRLFVDTAINAFTDAGDFRSVIIPIAPGTMYTVSKSTATIMRVGTSVEYPEAGAAITRFANHSAASTAPLTVTSGDSDHWMLVQLFVNADIGTEYGSIDAHAGSLMVEVGSVATEYEPCAAQSLTLSTPNGLPGIPVASGGNYTDENGQRRICDEIDLKRGVRVQRLGKMVYDGSDDEAWIVTGTRYRIAVPGMLEHTDATVAPPVMCDKYITVNPNTNYAGTISISAQQWGGAVVLLVKNDDLADVSAFKASLAEKPMEVLVALAAPVETPLAAEEIAAYAALRTNKPTANVMNDSGAGMAVNCMSVGAEDFFNLTAAYVKDQLNAIADYEGVEF